jgi:type IV pilus assembly protein PilO
VTPQQKVLLSALLLIIFGFGFHTYVYKSRAGEMATLSAEVVRLEQSIKNRQTLVADLAKVKRERAELEQKFSKIVERLPEEKEIPRLLRQVATVAGRSGLEVALFKQRDSHEQELYREIPVELVMQGGYHNLWGFLKQLSQIPRLVTVGELHAKTVETPDGQSSITTNLITTVFQSHSRDGANGSKPEPAAAR